MNWRHPSLRFSFGLKVRLLAAAADCDGSGGSGHVHGGGLYVVPLTASSL